jgi:hypothetical protein
MQVSLLVDPFFLIDEDAMHQGDLTGRSAKTQAPDLEGRGGEFAKGGD